MSEHRRAARGPRSAAMAMSRVREEQGNMAMSRLREEQGNMAMSRVREEQGK